MHVPTISTQPVSDWWDRIYSQYRGRIGELPEGIRVKCMTGFQRVRKLYQLANVGSGRQYRAFSGDLNTLLRGVVERIFLVPKAGFTRPPKPKSWAFGGQLARFRTLVLRRLSTTAVMTVDQFLDCYHGRKRDVYERAAFSLTTKKLQRSDAHLSCFTKFEKTDVTVKDPVPRVISPRNPRFNIELGRYLKPLEHKIYNAINNIFGSTVVMKGLNASERGRAVADAWAAIPDPVAVGADASRFDQHTSEDALAYEHSYYNGHFHCGWLRKLLKMQLYNVGHCRAGTDYAKFTVKGRRASGDMNTALGNVIIMCAMFFAYLEECNIPYRFLNDGDDCVLIISRKHLPLVETGLVDWFTIRGYTMVLEPAVDVLEEIEFCQSHPVWTPEGYRMVRDPRVTMSKDALTTCPVTNEWEWRAQMRAVGECGLALAGDIPVVGEYYEYMRRHGASARGASDHLNGTGFARLAARMHKRYSTPSDRTRISFWMAFGIVPERQYALEQELRMKESSYRPREVRHLPQWVLSW